MIQINFSNLTRKILFYIFNALSVCCILLIIMVPSCVTQLSWEKPTQFTAEQELLIVLMVIVPFLCSLIFFLCANAVKIFTKEDALRQLEMQFNNGMISFEQYQQTFEHIENFDFNKRKLKAELLIQKEKLKIAMEQKAKVEVESLTNGKEEKKLVI